MSRRLGLVAGGGLLPTIAAKNAFKSGIDIQVYSLLRQKEIQQEYIPELRHQIKLVSLLRFGTLIDQLKKDQISDVVFLGKVEKRDIFKSFRFDKTTIRLLKSSINHNDNTIFYHALEELEKHGLNAISQRKFLNELLLPKGVHSKKKPNASEWEDIRYGMHYAKEISGLDIGQTIVVRNKSVVAVEAMEGTDECIRRAGKLIGQKSGVVCKVERKEQDNRFDTPTIGVQTLITMKESGCRILAFEANKIFIVTPEEICRKSDESGIILVSLDHNL